MEPRAKGQRAAIGVDAGGTKVLGVVADERGEVLDRLVDDTPAQDAEASAATIARVAKELANRYPHVSALGVGAAGMVAHDGVMRFAPNLAWRELPLREMLSAALGLPTVVDNDANVAAWGEFRFGAGRDSNDLLMITVGTGIGGGIVAAGRLMRGAHGFAAEVGHIIVEPEGPLCGCGNRGCWEQVAAGRAIDRLGKEAARAEPGSRLAAMAGGDPERVTGPAVTQAARAGDAAAIGVLSTVGRRLGEGIAGLVNVLDPDVVVVGGGAVASGDLLLGPARTAFAVSVEGAQHRPPVPLLVAELGPMAGAVGAAALALDEHRASHRHPPTPSE
jgi:glucokinase